MTSDSQLLVMGGSFERLSAATEPAQATIITRTTKVPSVRPSPAIDYLAVIGLNPDQADTAWLAAARFAHELLPISRLVMVGDLDIERSALIARELDLPFHDLDTVRQVGDKQLMRRRLAAYGLPQPRYFAAEEYTELEKFLLANDSPTGWIVKPVDGMASAGVSRIRSAAELPTAWQRARYARFHRTTSRRAVMAEEFLEGLLLSVDAVSVARHHYPVCLARTVIDEATQVEVAHVTPSGLGREEQRLVCSYVSEILDALNVDTGWTHTELVLGTGGPAVIETHLRPGGAGMTEFISLATGLDVDSYTLTGEMAGYTLPAVPALNLLAPPPPRPTAMCFGFDRTGGVLEGFESAAPRDASAPGRVRQLIPNGSFVQALQHGRDRYLQAFAHGDSPAEALDRAGRLVSDHRPIFTGADHLTTLRPR